MAPRASPPATPRRVGARRLRPWSAAKPLAMHRVRRGATTLLGAAAFALGDYTEASSYFLESANQFESLGSPFGACHAQASLALALRHEGKLSVSLNAYRTAMRYQRDYRFTTESADMFEGLASIAAGLGHFDLAARLCGAAAGWRETYQEESWFPMPNDFHESAGSVRRRLGEKAWLEAYEAGRKLNSERAMRLADEAVSALEEELQRRSSGLTAREDRHPAARCRWPDQCRDRRALCAE